MQRARLGPGSSSPIKIVSTDKPVPEALSHEISILSRVIWRGGNISQYHIDLKFLLKHAC